VHITCADATSILVDGSLLPPDGRVPIDIGNREEKRIKVEYLRPTGVDEEQHTIKPGNTVQEVSCDAS
jgi:hypothetical protein